MGGKGKDPTGHPLLSSTLTRAMPLPAPLPPLLDCTISIVRMGPALERINTIRTKVGVLSLAFDFSTLVVAGEDCTVRSYDFAINERNWLDVESMAAAGRMLELRRHRDAAVMRNNVPNIRMQVPMGPGMGNTMSR